MSDGSTSRRSTRIVDIARVELVRRIRNRSAIITAFVAPVAVALVFGFLIGGSRDASFEIGVVDAAGTDNAAQLVGGLLAGDDAEDGAGATNVTFTGVDDRAAAAQLVDDGDLDAAIVVTSTSGGADSATGAAIGFEVLRSPDRVISGQVAQAIAQSFAARVDQVNLAVGATVALTGQPPSPELIDRAAAASASLELREADAGEGLDPFAFYGASMAILFLFFTVGFAGYSIIAERRSGVLGRVQASGASPAEIIIGKTAAVSVLAFSGFLVVWLTTRLVFGARWGVPIGVVLVIAATVLALGGVATFVAALARTQQQADVYVSAVTFTFALLGGNFVGPDAPPLLDRLSLLTPNGWALSAFTDLSIGGDIADVVVAVVVLIGFGAVFGTFGMLRLHRGFRA